MISTAWQACQVPLAGPISMLGGMELRVGQVIRKTRAERGLTTRELGKMIGVSGSAVSQWENGDTTPTTENCVNLSKALNLPIRQLMQVHELPDEMRIVDPDERTIVSLWRETGSELREIVLRLLLLHRDQPPP